MTHVSSSSKNSPHIVTNRALLNLNIDWSLKSSHQVGSGRLLDPACSCSWPGVVFWSSSKHTNLFQTYSYCVPIAKSACSGTNVKLRQGIFRVVSLLAFSRSALWASLKVRVLLFLLSPNPDIRMILNQVAMMAVETFFQVLTFLRPVFERPEAPPQTSARVEDYMVKWGNEEINKLLFWILIITTGISSMYLWLTTLSVVIFSKDETVVTSMAASRQNVFVPSEI